MISDLQAPNDTVRPITALAATSTLPNGAFSPILAPSGSFSLARPATLWAIPEADLAEFGRLPETTRDLIRERMLHFQALGNRGPGTVLADCRALAARMHGRRGWSVVRLRTMLYAYLATADWRILGRGVGRLARQSLDGSDLPPAFAEFWKTLCERNQRSCRAARRELLQIWRRGVDFRGRKHKAIPGYADWPTADPATGVPAGWSASNLGRMVPTEFELTAARVGRIAAADFRPKTITSRIKIRGGQYVLFDDQEYDVRVNYVSSEGQANSKAMKPLGLNSLDLKTAKFVSHGFKPTLWNTITEAKEKLKESDALWFLVDYITRIGYRSDTGTVLVVEHGTMAASEELERRIYDATGGMVTVDRSGILGDQGFAGLFEGQARGNFRFKAALESAFNLVRNEMASLPGPTGLNRYADPEENYGREKYNNSLLRAALALPPETITKLRFPFMTWSEFLGLALDMFQRINSRIDHTLEGWEKSGFFANEWRLQAAGEWLPVERFFALPPDQQAIVATMIDQNPNLGRTRQMSPTEAWSRESASLKRVPEHLYPVLLGLDFGVERRVTKDGLFQLESKELCGELRFLALDQPGLKAGETYLTYLNPFNPAALVVCNARGGYLATCTRWDGACDGDVAAIKEEQKKVARLEANLIKPIARRGVGIARDRVEMHRANAALLAEAGESVPSVPLVPSLEDCSADLLAAETTPIDE